MCKQKTLNVNLNKRIQSTIITQRTRITDITEHGTSEKWKLEGHMNDSCWTI